MSHRHVFSVSAFGLALALAACNSSTNVDKDGDGPGGGAGGAVGKAAAFDFSDTSSAAVAAEMSGEYEVAVWAARDSLAGNIGPGTLTVEFRADSLRLLLRDGAGAMLARRSVLFLDRSCNDGMCVNLWGSAAEDAQLGVRGPGRRVSVHHYYQAGNTTDYFEVNFYARGVVSGAVSGYKFRNDVIAYGAGVPAQLKSLAGTFTGPAAQQLCNPNSVTVDVNADSGSVRVRGKTPGFSGLSATCPARDHLVAWNGNDDIVVPDTAGGAILAINAGNRGGSLPGGGVFLALPAPVGATSFTEVYVNFAGAEGAISTTAATRP